MCGSSSYSRMIKHSCNLFNMFLIQLKSKQNYKRNMMHWRQKLTKEMQILNSYNVHWKKQKRLWYGFFSQYVLIIITIYIITSYSVQLLNAMNINTFSRVPYTKQRKSWSPFNKPTATKCPRKNWSNMHIKLVPAMLWQLLQIGHLVRQS